MIKKTVLSFVGIVVLIAIAAAAYFYYYPAALQAPAGPLPPAAQPDNSVEAGLVTAVSAQSVSFTKQDGTTATFSISTTTQITLAGQGASTPQTISDIKDGTMVLINPGAGPAAQSIIIIAPPAQ